MDSLSNAQLLKSKPSEIIESLLGIDNIGELSLSLDNTILFRNLFEFIDVSGKGAFGVVIKVVDIKKTDYAAIKIIPKSNSSTEEQILRLMEEAKILKSMNHNNVVNFREVYESHEFIFLVMDHVGRGSLSSLLQSHKLCDAECSTIIKHILFGLKYIHNRNYIHRDLKPDNVLLRSNDLSSVVIVDFGLGIISQREDNGFANTKSGTVIYMAPEQASSSNYGKQVDMWALGIIAYTLISGKHPLYTPSDNNDSYIEKLKSPQWQFNDCFSPMAKDFVLRLCKLDICSRYDAITALSHPWITRNLSAPIPKTLSDQIKEMDDIKYFKALVRAMLLISLHRKREAAPTPIIVVTPIGSKPNNENRLGFTESPFFNVPLGKFGLHKQSVIAQRKRYKPCIINKSEIDIAYKDQPQKDILSSKDIINFEIRIKCLNPKENTLQLKINNAQQTSTRKSSSYKAKLRNTDCFQLKAKMPTFRKLEFMEDPKEPTKNMQVLLKPITKQIVKNKSNVIIARNKIPCKHIVF